ncbi:hypothetical protein IFM61606_06219 [Aspergillus udagawae]|nr:hypothetical protein IFM51744_07977 [Aspergillus udagawae]GFG26246.1 hypothetical protein IFM61606_06219 [Aspergillus udagawae]
MTQYEALNLTVDNVQLTLSTGPALSKSPAFCIALAPVKVVCMVFFISPHSQNTHSSLTTPRMQHFLILGSLQKLQSPSWYLPRKPCWSTMPASVSSINVKRNLAPKDCFLSRQIFTPPGNSDEEFLARFIEPSLAVA